MATGPEHYAKAEHLVAEADGYPARYGDQAEVARQRLAEAQVHATLALAAATAMSAPVEQADAGFTQTVWRAWEKAAG